MNQYRGGSHQIRPRVFCPKCGRSIAVTFNKKTGDAYIRSHITTEPFPNFTGVKCDGSGASVPSRERNADPYRMH